MWADSAESIRKRLNELVRDEHAATLDYVRAQVATTSAPITSYFAQVADDPSVQIVSQAQLFYAKRALQGTEFEGLPLLSAAAPFKAGGRQGGKEYHLFHWELPRNHE